MKFEEFKQYLEENGVTIARTTEQLEDIPSGTLLYFARSGSRGITTQHLGMYEKNKEFGYDFGYCWNDYWRNEYNGEFILENPPESIVGKYELIINGEQITIIDADKDAITLTKKDFEEIYNKIK